MIDRERDPYTPVVVSVEVIGPLAASLRDEDTCAATASQVASGIDALAEDLGLSVYAAVTVDPHVDSIPSSSLEWVLVRVDGQRCRYPEMAPAFVVTTLVDRQLGGLTPAVDALAFPDTATGRSGGSSDVEASEPTGSREGAEDIAELTPWVSAIVADLVVEAVKTRPSVLLTPMVLARLGNAISEAARVNIDARVTDPKWLGPVLEPVLDIWAPLAPLHVVAEALSTASAEDGREAASEALITRLSRDEIEVLVPPDVASNLAREGEAQDDPLRALADMFFDELGVLLPRVRLVSNASSDRFAFQFNGLRTHWFAALSPDTLLTNASKRAALSLGVSGRVALNPGTPTAGCGIPTTARAIFEAAGFTVWDRASYVVLCLAVTIRRRPGFCVIHDKLQAQLETLAMSFPELVRAARSEVGGATFTAAVRELVAERLSVRNLHAVLERVVDLPYLALGRDRFAIVDDPVPATPTATAYPQDDPDLEDTVRALRIALRLKAARQSLACQADTLMAHVLDTKLEPTAPGDLIEGDASDLIEAIRHARAARPSGLPTPVILVNDNARAAISAAVRPAMPDVRILGYGDLPADQGVMLLDRLTRPRSKQRALEGEQ